VNQPVEKDLEMLKDLGLDPNWDRHDFSDQEEPRLRQSKLTVAAEVTRLKFKRVLINRASLCRLPPEWRADNFPGIRVFCLGVKLPEFRPETVLQ
jgi:hypothetical protein